MALAAPTLAGLAAATGAAARVKQECTADSRRIIRNWARMLLTKATRLAWRKRRLSGRPRHASFAVARSKIEARHRHRPVDRRLPRDYAVDRVFALDRHPVVMHDPIDVDHDLRGGAGHGPTDSTATHVGLVDLACLLSIARGGWPHCHRRKWVV